MRFNGVDLNTIHGAVSRAGEVVPGLAARDIATTETADGSTVVNVDGRQDEYTVRVNIAGRSYAEAMEARLRLAAWASSSGKHTAQLEPTHMPGKAYDAIVKSIGKVEKRFTTVDVVFALPRPVLYDITPQIRRATAAQEAALMVGGSEPAQPVIQWKPAAAVNTPRLMLDGVTFFTLGGTLGAGQTLEVALETGAVTIDGEHVESRIVYTESDLDITLEPGAHVLSASATGDLTVRWHTRWQ